MFNGCSTIYNGYNPYNGNNYLYGYYSMENKPKRTMTEAQKKARLANLEKGRLKRKEALKQKQESKEEEYDLSSESLSSASDGSDESDNEAFVISRKKKVVPRDVVMKSQRAQRSKSNKPNENENLKQDFDELKNMVQELAMMHKKQAAKKKPRSGGGSTKIVVLPQSNQNNNTRSSNDSVMDALRKSLM